MNTSFLSAIPAAPAQELLVPARPSKTGQSVSEADALLEESPVEDSESTGDTDKADAFAEMLAAMLSVATPQVETRVDTVQPAAIETVTSTATEVPLDGAGSPLFAASFTTVTAAPSTGSSTTTSIPGAEAGLPLDKVGAETTTPDDTAANAAPSVEIDEAGVTALASLDAQVSETVPQPAGSTLDAERSAGTVAEPAGIETSPVAAEAADQELPIVAVREATADLKGPQVDDVAGTPEPAAPVDQASESQSASPQQPQEDAVARSTPKPETIVQNDDVTAEQPVMKANPPKVTEAPKHESHPVAPETAPKNTAVVEEPYENPPEAKGDVDEGSSVKPATPLKSSSATSRTVSNAAPKSTQPESTSSLPKVEAAVDVGVKKDVPRERNAAPIAAAAEKPAAAPEMEVVDSTVNTANAASAANSASSVATSHPSTAAASAPAHVSQQVLQALAAYEADLPQNGSRSFEMLLDPPELGRLLVQMSRTSKGVDVRISAENDSVRSILETSGAEMQQSLQLSGFDLGQFSGSNSGGTFGNGEEWISAPSLASFGGSGPVPSGSSTSQRPGASAVNVMV
jgi:flagellar hook-length control protein FliK